MIRDPSPSTDQLIARHREALTAYLAASAVHGSSLPQDRHHDAAEASSDALAKVEAQAWNDLRCTVPVDVGELVRLALHLWTTVSELDSETEKTSTTATALEALRHGALALAGMQALQRPISSGGGLLDNMDD